MKIQSNGKIVLGGVSDTSFAMERYNSDGTLDSTFGTGGIVITAIENASKAYSMAIQIDEKIVLG